MCFCDPLIAIVFHGYNGSPVISSDVWTSPTQPLALCLLCNMGPQRSWVAECLPQMLWRPLGNRNFCHCLSNIKKQKVFKHGRCVWPAPCSCQWSQMVIATDFTLKWNHFSPAQFFLRHGFGCHIYQDIHLEVNVTLWRAVIDEHYSHMPNNDLCRANACF